MVPLLPYATPLLLRIPILNSPFLHTLLPSLKHTLSLTLQHFFPFAANLICPPPRAKRRILFTNGDSVSLSVSESSADFHFLSANHPQPAQALHPFVPDLEPLTRVEGGTRVGPLMALQVTVFPNSGVCLGVQFHHVAADGRAFNHFMKSWASICKTGGDLENSDLQMPSHDRTAIKDPDGLELLFLETSWISAPTGNDHEETAGPVLDCCDDNVRSTFALSQVQIQSLKRWVTNQLANDGENFKPFYVSSFVVTCALIWVVLAKSEEIKVRNSTANEDENDEPYHFGFVADCRSRLKLPLPTTYFGNCLMPCFVQAKMKELLGENEIVAATKATGKEVGRLESEGLKGMDKCMIKVKEMVERGKKLTVSGSAKLGVYEADFGWGRPKKFVAAHVEDPRVLSLAESRAEGGGIEVGLALNKDRMSRFTATLEEKLHQLS